MKRWFAALLFAFACGPALADVVVGQPAPAFSLPDASGRSVALADLKGRTVVLEWINPQCPFVRKHYGAQNMQSLQKRYTGQGVVWLAIQSTHPGHPEHFAPAELAEHLKAAGGAPTAILMDDDGKVGRLYGARTTPHMYVIDPAGRLVYAGAIDDKRSADPQDVKTARNHVAAALDELKAGRPVSVASTVPYGCSVKYR
jgi:peroxiredoxin